MTPYLKNGAEIAKSQKVPFENGEIQLLQDYGGLS
jgi:hypothetical protein